MKLLPFGAFLALSAGIALGGCSDDETGDEGSGATGSGASGSGASGATGSGATGSGASGATGSGATGGDAVGGEGVGGEGVGGEGEGGAGGGNGGDAQAFCTLFETTCTYEGGNMSFEDEADCLDAYSKFEGTIDDQATQLGCVEYHLDNAAAGDADVHCPHAAGNGPCNI
jgi:hypothetical protein